MQGARGLRLDERGTGQTPDVDPEGDKKSRNYFVAQQHENGGKGKQARSSCLPSD
jgi:hypothetical protein